MNVYKIGNRTQLLSSFSSIVSAVNNGSCFELTGIIRSKGERPYGGYYFNKLMLSAGDDNEQPYFLDVSFPERLHDMIAERDRVRVFCKLWASRNNLRVSPYVFQMEILERDVVSSDETVSVDDDMQEENEARFIKRMVKMCLRGNRPNVCLVFPVGSIVDEDMEENLRIARMSIDFTVVRERFTADRLVRRLSYLDECGYDAIAVIRGGGDDNDLTSQLNQPALLDVWGNMTTTTIAAVGHETNKKSYHLFRRHADISCGTPSLLGVMLKSIHTRKRGRRKRAVYVRIVVALVVLLAILLALMVKALM